MDQSITILSLCSGIGGLDEGVRLALPGARVVCYVEREAYCWAVLASRHEAEGMACPPIWSDVSTFDGRPWRGVDILTAGFPCQPFSLAGKRRGSDDHRHLWPDIARIIGEAQPGIVLLENVPGLISTTTIQHRTDLCRVIEAIDIAVSAAPDARTRWHGQSHRDRLYRRLLREHGISSLLYVLCELESLGYRVTAGLFSAEEVGAPHKRERLFIVAALDKSTGARHESERRGTAAIQQSGECVSGAGCDQLADTERSNPRTGATGEQRQSGVGRDRPANDGAQLADSESRGRGELRQSSGGNGQPDGRCEELADTAGDDIPLFPPGPSDAEQWRRIIEQYPGLAPATQPGFRFMADGDACRLDELRALGNGVVPLVAAYAFVSLWACLRERIWFSPHCLTGGELF